MGFIAGVVTEFEELFEVSMPGFQVNTAGAFALASLIYRDDGGVQCLEPGRDPAGLTIRGPDQRSTGANAVIGDTDASSIF